MKLDITTIRSLAATTACVLCCASAVWSAKPAGPGNGGGGGGGGSSAITYRIVRLNTSDGQGGTLAGQARDLNETGLVVGLIFDGALGRAACWTVAETSGGTSSTWALLDDSGFADQSTDARGCNDAGEIVGSAGDVHAVYWSGPDGLLEALPNSGEVSGAEAINDQGVICGWSGSSFSGLQAMAWSLVDGEWAPLALPYLGAPEQDQDGQPLPNRSYANAISNAAGGVTTIVGWSNGNAALWTVALNSDGILVAGPAMILDPGAEARGLNDTGIICGFGHLGPSSGGDGVVWVDAGPAELLTPTYSKFSGNPQQVYPVDVNDSGLIVGDNLFRAVAWPNKDSAPILLESFLAKGKTANFDHVERACAVNESNEIVGYGSDDGVFLPFLAVPE